MRGRRRVRFVDQWTARTGSDHRALFVHVRIRDGRDGPWVDLLLVSVNMGGHFSKADLDYLVSLATATGFAVVFAMQEAGDQAWLSEAADSRGLTYLGGDGKPGQASTPVLLDERIELRRSAWQLILDRLRIGPGAGPDQNKPKWWNSNRLLLEGVPFGASSFHEVASQQNRPRYLAALRQARPVVRAMLGARRPLFLIGDTNSDHDQPLSHWLREHGLTSNHDQLGEIATRGGRSIDTVLVASRFVTRRGA